MSDKKEKVPFSSMTMEEQLEEGIALAKKLAKANFDPMNDEMPCALALVNKNSKTGEDFAEPEVVIMIFDPGFLDDNEMKTKLLETIRDFNKECDSIFMIFMCRVVSAFSSSKDDIKKMTSADFTSESKMLMAQHRSLPPRTFIADIKKGMDGLFELGDFEEAETVEGNILGGDFFTVRSN